MTITSSPFSVPLLPTIDHNKPQCGIISFEQKLIILYLNKFLSPKVMLIEQTV